MKTDPAIAIDLASLRRQAEQKLGPGAGYALQPEHAEADIRRQLHELQVSQIELEMQHDAMTELQRAKLQIEVGLARYTDLYDFAPISYFTLDKKGVLCEVNLTGARLLGLPRSSLVGRRLDAFISPDSQAAFHFFLAQVYAGDTRQPCELVLITADNKPVYVTLEANTDPTSQTFRAVVKNISQRKMTEAALRRAHAELETKVQERTLELLEANHQLQSEIEERKRVEAALKESERFYQATLNALSAHILVLDENGFILSTNQSLRDFSQMETAGSNYLKICDAASVSFTQQASAFSDGIRAVMAGQTESFSMEYPCHTDTDKHWFIGKVTRFASPGGNRIVVAHENITKRKLAEEALHQSQQGLRQLIAHQVDIKESERKRIAREIHDDLGQNLLALRIDVSMLAVRTGNRHPKLHQKVNTVLNHIDTTIKSVRAIINNLRPSVLDLGLTAAIDWQIKEFQRRSGIACTLTVDSEDFDAELDDDRATVLFRILQESLVNVARHAQASQVGIHLSNDGKRIAMSIIDNGVGLHPGCRRKANTFGLLGIDERVTSLHGELLIDGDPETGTMISISIPMEPKAGKADTDQ